MLCDENTKLTPPMRARAMAKSAPDTDCINALVTGTLMVSGDLDAGGGPLPGSAVKRTSGAVRSTLLGKHCLVVKFGMSRYSPKVLLGSSYTNAMPAVGSPCSRGQAGP